MSDSPDHFSLWWVDDRWTRTWTAYVGGTGGELVHVGDYEQGPFDTDLEVFQWAWRLFKRHLPPY